MGVFKVESVRRKEIFWVFEVKRQIFGLKGKVD
jgi:hypothetical protein